VQLTGIQWLALHGNASLGLKHPANRGPSRAQVVPALERILTMLFETGCITHTEYQVARAEAPTVDAPGEG
jgi:hypothetical protein